jgi:hypothetical protein
VQGRHSRLAFKLACPAADILGDHLTAQAGARRRAAEAMAEYVGDVSLTP